MGLSNITSSKSKIWTSSPKTSWKSWYDFEPLKFISLGQFTVLFPLLPALNFTFNLVLNFCFFLHKMHCLTVYKNLFWSGHSLHLSFLCLSQCKSQPGFLLETFHSNYFFSVFKKILVSYSGEVSKLIAFLWSIDFKLYWTHIFSEVIHVYFFVLGKNGKFFLYPQCQLHNYHPTSTELPEFFCRWHNEQEVLVG